MKEVDGKIQVTFIELLDIMLKATPIELEIIFQKVNDELARREKLEAKEQKRKTKRTK